MNAHTKPPIGNELDKLIRQLEGLDYYDEQEDEKRIPLWLGMLPAILAAWALAYLLYMVLKAVAW